MEWYLKVLRQYADFSGRTRRKEYWMFVFMNFLISFLISTIDYWLFGMTIISSIYVIALIIPSIAVAVRRIQDTGRNGLWILAAFVPLIGTIWVLILLLQDSESDSNTYGPNPKNINPNL
ncbi:MAG: DUF805 domain-containing protein [Psychroflexus halocasei]|uniref:DUF805 domain-containing protein n=1 Tax=Psychroflexus sp. S27 TaxID=1982757 RepID=UPI000C2A2B3A|nr:DUF805 domain-containing protein [Psychroflexus sp. S27]PJX24690.1 hypothetical protein CAP47_03150 [Psychroflexus sp. S27]